MALVQPILANLSGSVGANTFSHNKGGPYLRRRAKPVNNTSARRTIVRSYLSAGTRSWEALTQANRDLWSRYAQLNPVINRQGVSTTVSGLQMYNRMNTRNQDAGNTVIAVPPTTPGPGSLLTAAIIVETVGPPPAGTMRITYTATPLAAGARLQIWWSKVIPVTRDPNFNQCTFLAYTVAAAASPQNFLLPVVPPAGSAVNFYVAIVDIAGRSGPARKVRVTF